MNGFCTRNVTLGRGEGPMGNMPAIQVYESEFGSLK